MGNGANLLPDDLRDKEREEREKVKQAMGRPDFKLHLPEENKANGAKNNLVKKTGAGIEIGLSSGENKISAGNFQLKKKEQEPLPPPPVKPPVIKPPVPFVRREPVLPPKFERPIIQPKPTAPKIEPVKNLPKPEIKSEPVKVPPDKPVVMPRPENKFIKMRIPAAEKDFGAGGQQVISEAADKIEEIKKSRSFFNFFRKKPAAFSAKKTAAEVNLISEDYLALVKTQFWRKANLLLALLLALLIVFAVGFMAIKLYKVKLIKKYQELAYQIQEAEAAVNSFSADEQQAEKLKTRAKVLQTVLKNHVYWSKIFNALEHNTASDVYYTNFVAEDNGAVLLAAVGKSYADIAKQLLIFQTADFVESVEINSASQSEESESPDQNNGKESSVVRFNIKLKLKDSALYVAGKKE